MIRKGLESLSKHERASLEMFSLVMKYAGAVQAQETRRQGRLKNIHCQVLGLEALRRAVREPGDDEVRTVVLLLEWFIHFDFKQNMILIDMESGDTLTVPRKGRARAGTRIRNGFAIGVVEASDTLSRWKTVEQSLVSGSFDV